YRGRWEEAMRDPTSIDVHLQTLAEEKRASASAVLRGGPHPYSLGALGGGLASLRGHPEVVADFLATCRGQHVQADPDQFVNEALRQEITEAVRKYFRPGVRDNRQIRLMPGRAQPTRSFQNGKIRFGFETSIQDSDSRFRVGATMVIEVNAAALTSDTAEP